MKMNLKDLFKRKKKDKKKKKGDEFEYDPESDHIVHEKYTKEEVEKK